MDLLMSAYSADAFCKAEQPGFALHDAPGGAFLLRCNGMSGAVVWIKQLECFTDQIISHRISPPYPKDW